MSVEKIEEAIKAIEYPTSKPCRSFSTCSVCARLRFLQEAVRKQIGTWRVPLASGLLTGKMKRDTQFASDDHRQFNRHGEAFDMGETFSVSITRRVCKLLRRFARCCPTA